MSSPEIPKLPRTSLFPANDIPATEQESFDAFESALTEGDPDLILEFDDKPPIGRSWAFSFQGPVGFISKSGGHGPAATYGEQTVRNWIDKVMHTAKGAHPIHPPEYGLDDPFGMMGRHQDSSQLANYEGTVRDALMLHPRITEMSDFEMETDEDSETVLITFTVVLDDESQIPMDVTIP